MVVPEHGGSGRGHPKKDQKSADTRGDFRSPGIVRASLEHRPSNRSNGQNVPETRGNMKHCKIFEVWGQGQRAGGIQKRTKLVQMLGVISGFPSIERASRRHRSGIDQATEILDHVVP